MEAQWLWNAQFPSEVWTPDGVLLLAGRARSVDESESTEEIRYFRCDSELKELIFAAEFGQCNCIS